MAVLTGAITKDKILVVDFGSQVTHLICRRCREIGAYSELVSCLHITVKYLEEQFTPRAVILSGGPSSVYEDGWPHLPKDVWKWLLDKKIPLLGICYGLQEMMYELGGKVSPGKEREFGNAELSYAETGTVIFDGIKDSQVWMSHGDKVTALADGFKGIATSGNSEYAAVANFDKKMIAVQFHPEVTHTKAGTQMIKNFAAWALGSDAMSLGQNWSMKNYFALESEKIKQLVLQEDCYVLGGISGGVDSSVCAALCQRALGSDRFFPFLIDTGLMRYKESEEVKARLTEHIPGLNLTVIDASEEFFEALKTETEPEKKRKIIGKLFIDQFEKAIKEINKYHPGKNIPIEKCYLLQGTLYPDVIESTSFKGPSSVIKSHHNVGGLPDRLPFKGLLEPLRMLFKDEVRQLGREAGLAEETLMRHPFPGPGLGIRIVGGAITRERADILRLADKIFLDELKARVDENGVTEYQKIAQAFATLMPTTKTVGVMGDARTYEMTCGLRAVETSDFMTADWYKMPYDLLGKVSNRIINEVRGINRVVYDVSSKPPATTEWE